MADRSPEVVIEDETAVDEEMVEDEDVNETTAAAGTGGLEDIEPETVERVAFSRYAG